MIEIDLITIVLTDKICIEGVGVEVSAGLSIITGTIPQPHPYYIDFNGNLTKSINTEVKFLEQINFNYFLHQKSITLLSGKL